MSDKDEILVMINLLAGAAQAGAQGILAQASYNLVKASEAVVKAKKLNKGPEFQQAVMQQLLNAQHTLERALQIPEAMAEAKQDILNAGQKPYDPNLQA